MASDAYVLHTYFNQASSHPFPAKRPNPQGQTSCGQLVVPSTKILIPYNGHARHLITHLTSLLLPAAQRLSCCSCVCLLHCLLGRDNANKANLSPLSSLVWAASSRGSRIWTDNGPSGVLCSQPSPPLCTVALLARNVSQTEPTNHNTHHRWLRLRTPPRTQRSGWWLLLLRVIIDLGRSKEGSQNKQHYRLLKPPLPKEQTTKSISISKLYPSDSSHAAPHAGM